MIDIDKWQEILGALRKNKLRTFLTAFGVFWGIFMLVIMLGSGNGLLKGVTAGFGDFATNSTFIWAENTTVPYKGYPRGRWYNFENDDIKALRDNIPSISIIAPRLQGGGFRSGDNVVHGLKTGAFSIYGDYPEIALIDPIRILNGRFLNKIDIDKKRKVAVIGKRVYDVLFNKGEDPVGQYIRIQGVYFQVIGVFEPKNKNVNFGGDKEQTIFLPFSSMQQTYNYGNVVGWFSITSKPEVPVSVVEEQAIQLLKKRHSVSPLDENGVGHFNIQKEYLKMTGLFLGISILIWIVGIGTLFAGVIGVSNIMMVIVKERTRETGIRRALGATPMAIMGQIVSEAIFLTSIAGFLGLSAGVAVLEGVTKLLEANPSDSMMFKSPQVDINIALIALVVLIVCGTLAGMIPARKAVSVKPVEALKG